MSVAVRVLECRGGVVTLGRCDAEEVPTMSHYSVDRSTVYDHSLHDLLSNATIHAVYTSLT